MKKILPIVAVFGTSVLLAGCGNNPTMSSNLSKNTKSNIEIFKDSVNEYADLDNYKTIRTSLNNYTLSLEDPNANIEPVNDQENTVGNKKNLATIDVLDDNTDDSTIISEDTTSEENTTNNDIIENDSIDNFTEKEIEQISTLYSLSSDIDESCEDFCELKEEITNAIIETQSLINKLQSKEIELDAQQRMFISEQSAQLKSLGRQLSNITTELNFNLSDLNSLMLTKNSDIDSLSLKYLVVLDNLVNGNEMLQNGLNSLNLMNQMMNLRGTALPPNNQGRILYGFKRNNEDPTIKDYYIDENGNLVENNSQTDETTNENNSQEVADNTEKTTNVDTYKNTHLVSNIDTYGNNYQNIDTFYNTALLDNQFMYGRSGYGGMGYGNALTYGAYGVNPYANPNNNYNLNQTTTNGAQNTDNTPNEQEKKTTKNKKRFKFTKNVDTYRDENTPTLRTRFANIKKSITDLFGGNKDKAKNPIFRSNEQNSGND